MRIAYKDRGYALEFDSPEVRLWVGADVVSEGKMRKEETELDTARRIVNRYLKGPAYTEYLHILALVGLDSRRNEDNWLGYCSSVYSRILRGLLAKAEQDIGGRF